MVNPELLLAKDKEGHNPLALSVSNMHINISKCLFEHMHEKGYEYGAVFTGKSGEELVVLAISCLDFNLAKMIINKDLFGCNSSLCRPLCAAGFVCCWLCVLPALCADGSVLCAAVRLFFGDTFQIYEDATSLLSDFPDAIWSTNEDGHEFIQYSVISRSEKIYNLVYEMSEHKSIYKTMKDSSGNNLLHLAARLAPTYKLNLISGAAMQIQRELQWFKEVERFVCPLNRIQKNSDDETPEMVFTREHKDLVIEGENWVKKISESYTITAALIITIVFAAAITVPGGNNQESGIPVFTDNVAFTVFAISDAISLFTAVTSLLMFLSILTARFAEQDFLFNLPTKLIIGLTMLFLSTTAMIIAFGATLFLVFGKGNLTMLIPIGALTCLPITSFVTLQCPFIVELIGATYGGGIFVKEENDYFY